MTYQYGIKASDESRRALLSQEALTVPRRTCMRIVMSNLPGAAARQIKAAYMGRFLLEAAVRRYLSSSLSELNVMNKSGFEFVLMRSGAAQRGTGGSIKLNSNCPRLLNYSRRSSLSRLQIELGMQTLNAP